MLDRFLLPVVKSVLQPVAAALARRGVGADGLTVAGFAIGLGAVPALALQFYGVALIAILVSRLFDALDGAVARLNGPTERGAFFDITLDFAFYGCIPLGFALADPAQNALPAAVLLAAFIGTGSSFLAFAAIAAKRGLTSDVYPQKGIYYLTGLTEGAETIAALALMCVFPGSFPLIAYVFAAACLATTLTRLRQGWVVFAPPPPGTDGKPLRPTPPRDAG
ncbi:CDP-alcohol phosphatidyltransferase family protein [Bosea sp. R86505]|uniref:CDP-alcohol phosphatidyltransferase family protein n=1 Tax=Bosea sp. R86505 TaxID=3101710 RepID=UPI00366EEC7E